MAARTSTIPSILEAPSRETQESCDASQNASALLLTRLVVLVPSLEVDLAEFASSIRAMAQPRELGVLLVGQCLKPEEELTWRRQIVALASLVQERSRITVEFRVGRFADWTQILKPLLTEGDLVICHWEQSRGWVWRRNNLAHQLGATFNVPTCELSGLYGRLPSRSTSPAQRALAWVTPILVILLFAVIQHEIQTLTTGWVTPVALSASILIELILIAL